MAFSFHIVNNNTQKWTEQKYKMACKSSNHDERSKILSISGVSLATNQFDSTFTVLILEGLFLGDTGFEDPKGQQCLMTQS